MEPYLFSLDSFGAFRSLHDHMMLINSSGGDRRLARRPRRWPRRSARRSGATVVPRKIRTALTHIYTHRGQIKQDPGTGRGGGGVDKAREMKSHDGWNQ